MRYPVIRRTPEAIRPLLTSYMALLDDRLPGLVTGLYIHGSIALDAFHERLSDIDVVAFLSRRVTSDDLARLAELHRRVAAQHPQRLLEVSYLQWDDLGRVEQDLSSPFYHDDKLAEAGNFDVNWVTWWIIKHRGIALIGPDPTELPLTVEWASLIAAMHDNLNRYWASYIRKPQRIAWLLSDYGIQWTVLGVLRPYYSFAAHDITSKRGAGDYALAHLPRRWHTIIREAIRLREQEESALYASKLRRAADAYNYLRFVIHKCNTFLA